MFVYVQSVIVAYRAMIPLIIQRIEVNYHRMITCRIVNGNFGIFIPKEKQVIYFNYDLANKIFTFSSHQ